MIEVQYISVVLFCIILLFIVLKNHIKTSGLQNTSRIYIRMIGCNITNFASDIAVRIFRLQNVNMGIIPYYIVMVFFLVSNATAALFWLWYVVEEHKINWFHKTKNHTIAFLPLTVYVAITLSSPWTHLIFYIDKNGTYHRGPLFILQYIMPLIYISIATGFSLIRAMDKKNFLQKNKYLLLAFFLFPTSFCAVVKLFLQDLPVICMGITMLLIIIYLYQQNEKISIDPLTQINNRFQIIRFLTGKISAHDSKKNLYLFIMDLNLFKKINDNYGHVEGDKALVRVATVMKKICFGKDYFIGRYGGDEFIMIAELDSEQLVKELCDEIHANIEQANKDAGTEYKISLSIGCAKYNSSFKDITAFIAAADEELYKVKKARNISR